MWMGVLFGWPSMGRPTRVAYAVCAVQRMESNRLFEISQFTFGTAQLEMMLFIGNGYSGRVVPAILELSQTVEDQRHNLFITNVTDNSTHMNKKLHRPGTLKPEPRQQYSNDRYGEWRYLESLAVKIRLHTLYQ
jgi:hypothetical protein